MENNAIDYDEDRVRHIMSVEGAAVVCSSSSQMETQSTERLRHYYNVSNNGVVTVKY